MDIIIPLHFAPYYVYVYWYILLYLLPTKQDIKIYLQANLPGLAIFVVLMFLCREVLHFPDTLSLVIAFVPDYIVRFKLNKIIYKDTNKDIQGQVILYFTMGAFGVVSPYVLKWVFDIGVWESQLWLALPTIWLHYRATRFIFRQKTGMN